MPYVQRLTDVKMTLMGIVQNVQGLYAARFFLGVAEYVELSLSCRTITEDIRITEAGSSRRLRIS